MALPAQTSLLRRLLVGVALLGIVVVTHLALQKANGFAAGCTGLGEIDFSTASAVTGEGSGCATVTEGEYADFLGISNIVLGLIFYVIVAGLRLGYATLRDDRLRLASGTVVSIGFLYTGYLVYLQAAVIGSFCILCMTSAALVTTLFILHVIEHRRLTTASSPPPARRAAPEPTGFAALRPYATVLGGFVVLLASVFGLAARTDSGPDGPTAQAASSENAQIPPRRIEDVTGVCTYDADYLPIDDMTPFMQGPSRGNPDSPIKMVKVLDPNCPHCRELSSVLDPFIEANPESAEVFYVSHPLRQESVGQVIALRMAADEGKYFDLLDEMFERQDATWGMTLPELVATVNAVGMDGAAFEAALQDDTQLQGYLNEIQALAEQVTEAFTSQSGRLSVPKLAINGRVVESTYASYSERCLAEFVAEAQ